MKKNRISITINRPLVDVFEFTINPKNTPRWIEYLEIEETNEWPPKIGTIYRNRGLSSKQSEYNVFAFKPYQLFELISVDRNYHVRYTYKQLEDGNTEMEYLEWVNKGELEQPFTRNILEKLKTEIEHR